MLVWLMAALVAASILTVGGMLLYARRAARAHAGDALAVEQEVADRLIAPREIARALSQRVVSTQAIREPWGGDKPASVDVELARLDPEIGALLRPQKRLVFPAGDVALGAEYAVEGAARVPAGMSQIGVADGNDYILCAYQDRRPDVLSLRRSDGRQEMSFRTVHHCISVLADGDLGKRKATA